MILERALTVKQVAEKLSLTVPRVFTLIFNGSLIARRIGKDRGDPVRVLPQDPADYIERAKQPGKIKPAVLPPVFFVRPAVNPPQPATPEPLPWWEALVKIGDRVRYCVRGKVFAFGWLARKHEDGQVEILTETGETIRRKLTRIVDFPTSGGHPVKGV